MGESQISTDTSLHLAVQGDQVGGYYVRTEAGRQRPVDLAQVTILVIVKA